MERCPDATSLPTNCTGRLFIADWFRHDGRSCTSASASGWSRYSQQIRAEAALSSRIILRRVAIGRAPLSIRGW